MSQQGAFSPCTPRLRNEAPCDATKSGASGQSQQQQQQQPQTPRSADDSTKQQKPALASAKSPSLATANKQQPSSVGASSPFLCEPLNSRRDVKRASEINTSPENIGQRLVQSRTKRNWLTCCFHPRVPEDEATALAPPRQPTSEEQASLNAVMRIPMKTTSRQSPAKQRQSPGRMHTASPTTAMQITNQKIRM